MRNTAAVKCFSLAAAILAVVLALPCDAAEPAESGLATAQTLLDRGDFAGALATLPGAAVDASGLSAPARAKAAFIRADALLGQGQSELALEPAQHAVELSAGSANETADALLLLARVRLMASDGPQTLAALDAAEKAAVAAENSLPGIRTLRVKDREVLLLSASRPAEAIVAARTVLGAVPTGFERDRLRFINTLGVALLRDSKFDAARQEFKAAFDGRTLLLSPRHPETLESQHNYAVALRRLGKAKDADDQFGKALEMRIEVLGADHPDTLTTRMLVVRQLVDKSQLDLAEKEAREVLAGFERRFGMRHMRTLGAMSDLAGVLFRLGRASDALDMSARAYVLAVETMDESAPEAMSIGHEYAGLLWRAGRLPEALRIFQRVLASTRKVFDDENMDTLATLNSIAVVVSDMGRLDDAIGLYRYVADIVGKSYSKSHPNRISAVNNLAIALLVAERNEEALPLIEDVVTFRIAEYGPEGVLTLLSKSNKAAILAGLKRSDEALAIHREVLSIRERRFGARHPDTLKSAHNLASTLDEVDRWSEALPIFEDLVSTRSAVLGRLNNETVKSMRGLAGVLASLGRIDEARSVYLKVVDIAEELRVRGGMTDSLRRSFFSTIAPVYKALAVLETRLANFEGAFRASELSKARTLFETSAIRSALQSTSLSAADAGALTDLEVRISRLDVRIPTVSDVAERAGLDAERNALADELARLNARLADLYPSYRRAAGLPIVEAADLKALLAADTAMISFVDAGKQVAVQWAAGNGLRGTALLPAFPNLAETVEAYRAAIARPDGVDGLRYVDPGRERRMVWKLPDGSFRIRAFEAGPWPGATPVRDIQEIRDALSLWVLRSLPAELLAKKKWLISLDGVLSLVPFDTLSWDGRLLAEDHDISLFQSASMMNISAEREKSYIDKPRKPLLAIGAPSYSHNTKEGPLRTLDRLEAATPTGASWQNLPGASQELGALGTIFELADGTNLFKGAAASQDTVRSLQIEGVFSQYRYVVFSAHGYLDRQSPDRSAIVLSQTGLRSGDDGYLRASELSTFGFSTDLVVLSACETGVGKWVSGEGVLGLPFALSAAGNANTLLTLWPVFDGSTAEFMRRFFSKLKSDMPIPAALAETKREFLTGQAGDSRRSPAYWAPFTLFGSANGSVLR